MNLSDWLNNGWLAPHRATRQEITDLLAVADRDLTDCQTTGLSADWKLSIAYNAGLQVATAALVACGYRAGRQSHHYRTIHSLCLTIGADKRLVAQFDQFRKKRNIADYERIGATSDQEADEMRTLASELREQVEEWIRRNHPTLIR